MTSAPANRANLLVVRGRLLLYVLIVACAGGWIGWAFFSPGRVQPVLFFEAAVVDLSGKPHIEGEKIEVRAVLINDSNQPVVLKALPHSCACMAANREGPVQLPLALEAHSRTPLSVVINTAGQGGLKRYRLTAVAETAQGREVPDAELMIVAKVYAALYAHPNYFHVSVPEDRSSEPIHREVCLLDKWEEKGLEVASVTSTAGNRFRFTLKPDEGDFSVGALVLKRRHILEFDLLPRPGSREIDEVITIVPADKRAKPATITLTGKVVPPYALVPGLLTFYGTQPGKQVERTVQYTYQDVADNEITVLEAPPGFSVRFEHEEQGRKQLVVSCMIPSAGKRSQGIVFQVGSKGAKVRLPIEVVSDPVGP